MSESQADNKFQQITQTIIPQGNLLRTWGLKGGVSAQVTALEIEQPDGQTIKMIVRQHGAGDLKQNPHIAADEFRLLCLLQSVGLAVPKPYHLDQSCQILSTPYLVIEYIEGETEFSPSRASNLIPQLATYLARIHTLDCSSLDISFLPSHAQICTELLKKRPENIDDSLDEGHIRDVLETAWPFPQMNTSVLLHGDFWPGNILWKDEQLVAVIDWEDAKFGDPLADVAISRLDILWAFGVDAMQNFTQQYQSVTNFNFTNLPYWDLYAALRPASKIAEWAPDKATEKNMRAKHRWFISQVFEKISAQ